MKVIVCSLIGMQWGWIGGMFWERFYQLPSIADVFGVIFQGVLVIGLCVMVRVVLFDKQAKVEQ
jgi:apolipoprotein N-acyltransferase